MERYYYARKFIQLARVLAVFASVVSLIAGAATKTFTGFVLAVLGGLLYAFAILVFADLIECFLQIEANTRSGKAEVEE